jgi:cysteinyl-tRNA synthetase
MSKSIGNLYTLDDLAARGFSAMEVRYVLLGGHYRKPLNFTLDSLTGAREALSKLARGARLLASNIEGTPRFDAVDFGPFQAAWDSLLSDLNTPGALGGMFTGLREASTLTGDAAAKALAALNRLLRALGLTLPEESSAADILVPAAIQALAEERWQCRLAKNWAKSDELRATLAALGWIVKDGKDAYALTPADS